MLSPRLTNCPECANIPSLLKKIDCKLAELGNNLYNNISYMLNKPVPSSDILQLIGYRRILMYKYCNPSYVEKYSVQMIASRVIRLTAGCVSKCNELERCLEEPCDIKIVPNPTTTSTSTLPITTTTSTSSTSTSTTSSTSSTTTSTTTAAPTTTTTTTSGIYYYTANRFVCPDCETPDPNVRVVSSPTLLNIGEWYAHFYVPTEVSFYITGTSPYDPMAIPVDGSSGSVTCTCPEVTTTTSTSSTSSTTTTSTTATPATECAALVLNAGNVYTYDVGNNTSVNRGYFSGSNDIANTATKMWFLGSFIEEYDITVFPWSSAFNRNITYNTQLASGNGLCAKDDVTLITTNSATGFPNPIVSIDISGSIAVETIIGYLPINTYVTGDLIYTTTGKLIITTSNTVSGGPYIIQYDYATMNLEVQTTIPFYDAFGLIEANNNLYLLRTGGDVYQVDLNYPYAITLVQNTGLTNTAGASQTPSCCNVNLIPQSSSTTTTSSTSTTSTTSTTTTLAPTGFNTIYTHFEAL